MGSWERGVRGALAGWGRRLCAVLVLASGVGMAPAWSATHSVGTFVELASAITNAANGDVIEVTRDIVVTAQISVASGKQITIAGKNGQKRLLTVPRPGVNEDGSNNASPSSWRLFSVSGSLTLRDLHLKGGSVSQGGAINVAPGASARMERVTVSHSRGGGAAGGGIWNQGSFHMTDSRLMRNSAYYGGGFVNRGGTMVIDRSTFSENRSEHYQGGGGAGESESSGVMYINNSTFSNNKSTENGGAIKNNTSTLYVANSSFTGNVAYGDFANSRGGAIGVTGSGNVYLVNNVFAYNYSNPATSGPTNPPQPSSYVLDDLHWHPGSGMKIWAYYNVFHDAAALDFSAKGVTADKVAANVGNVTYSAAINGSNDTIFSGGVLSRVTHGDAKELGTAKVYQPLLLSLDGAVLPSLKSGSWLLQPAQAGVRTAVNTAMGSMALAYSHAGEAWATVAGSMPAPLDYLVDKDQLGLPRLENLAATPMVRPVRGATGRETDNVYQVKVVPNDPTRGQTDGGSVYGEVVSGGTTVTLTALPANGQTFVRWECESGVTEAWCGSTEPVITIPVDSNIWIQPVFTNTTDGKVSITYLATGATGGTAPAPARVTSGSSYTVAGGGNLVRPGHAIQAWNTAPAGAGTSIAFNSIVNESSNIVLYPQWAPAATQKTFAATDITMNAATISGEVTSGSIALTVGMGWGTSAGSLVVPADTTQSLAADGATKTLSLSLSGLQCKTTYHYASYLEWGANSIFDPAPGQFTTSSCRVSYNGNGATGGIVPTGNFDMGPSETLTAAGVGTLARTGYTFNGWNTAADGSGTAYAVGASVAASSAGAVVLYAQWLANPSVDTDAPSEVTSGGAKLSGTVSPGGLAGTAGLAWGTVSGNYASSQQLATLAAGDPAASLSFEATGLTCKSTYYVATWFESGGTRTYGPEQTVTTSGCALTFNSNGAQTGSVPAGGSNYGPSDGLTIPSNSGGLQRRGYTFNGWNTQSDGQGSAFAAGAAVAGLTSSMTLYAQWQQIRSATVTSSAGPVTLQMACTSCALTTADVEVPGALKPSNTNFPWGLQSFELIDVVGTVTVTMTLPGNIQGTPSLWKSVNGTFSPVTGATFSGNSVTYTLTDNGELDEDATLGVIRDPVGVGVAAVAAGAVPVPTWSEWAQAGVTAMLALLGALAVRRRACAA